MAITASTWQIIDRVGAQPITDVSSTQKHPLLTRVRAKDVGSTARGEAEFVYLKGVASTVAGDAVVYDESTGLTTRTVAASKGPLAVAMSACAATTSFGWYQVYGVGVVTVGTVSDNGAVYTTATDGSLDDAQVDSQQVIGAFFRSDTDTGRATIGLNYPVAGTDDQLS